jgi:hypothetical protein
MSAVVNHALLYMLCLNAQRTVNYVIIDYVTNYVCATQLSNVVN